MELVPESQVLLGVDVIGSARNPGHHLNPLWLSLARMLNAAFQASGIRDDELTDVELAGDGALYTLPTSRLGTVLDFSQRLDQLAAEHNRWRKPDIRLRIAVEMGVVGEEPGYYAAKIYRSRLLNAPVFKRLVERCLAERPDGSVNTGLIVSGQVYREAFGGDYTQLVKPADFAELEVTNKEFTERARVRVPGFDARSLTEFAVAAGAPEDQHNETRQDVDAAGPDGGVRVTNRVVGDMHGVQAGIVHGDITFGRDPR